MITLPKKCVYALQAMFELAQRNQTEPINARKIAESQGIPLRFLETILNELKQGGFVSAIRGNQGGFLLSKPASSITAGEIIDFLRKTDAAPGTEEKAAGMSLRPGDFAFENLWSRLTNAICEVLYKTTLTDLVEKEMRFQAVYVGNYII